MSTPNLALSYIVSSQAQKEVTHNAALNDLDFLVQASVIDTTISTPPASPNLGDTYVIAASPTGAWAGFANAVIAWYSGWTIKLPEAGWIVFTRNGNHLLCYTGSAWALLTTPKLSASATAGLVNADLRGGNFYGADMMYDFAAKCENSIGSGIWKAGSVTADGIHPNQALDISIAADAAANMIALMAPL